MIVQVKENQPNLLNDCIETAETMPVDDEYTEPVEKTRNRIESRHVEVFEAPILSDPDKWELAEAVVKVDRTRMVFDTTIRHWKDTGETAD